MATTAEQLILRGLHLVIRTAFAPNDPTKQAEHFMALQSDIGPWLTDYATEIAKPINDDITVNVVRVEERGDDYLPSMAKG